jgi:hypothetical protein
MGTFETIDRDGNRRTVNTPDNRRTIISGDGTVKFKTTRVIGRSGKTRIIPTKLIDTRLGKEGKLNADTIKEVLKEQEEVKTETKEVINNTDKKNAEAQIINIVEQSRFPLSSIDNKVNKKIKNKEGLVFGDPAKGEGIQIKGVLLEQAPKRRNLNPEERLAERYNAKLDSIDETREKIDNAIDNFLLTPSRFRFQTEAKAGVTFIAKQIPGIGSDLSKFIVQSQFEKQLIDLRLQTKGVELTNIKARQKELNKLNIDKTKLLRTDFVGEYTGLLKETGKALDPTKEGGTGRLLATLTTIGLEATLRAKNVKSGAKPSKSTVVVDNIFKEVKTTAKLIEQDKRGSVRSGKSPKSKPQLRKNSARLSYERNINAKLLDSQINLAHAKSFDRKVFKQYETAIKQNKKANLKENFRNQGLFEQDLGRTPEGATKSVFKFPQEKEIVNTKASTRRIKEVNREIAFGKAQENFYRGLKERELRFNNNIKRAQEGYTTLGNRELKGQSTVLEARQLTKKQKRRARQKDRAKGKSKEQISKKETNLFLKQKEKSSSSGAKNFDARLDPIVKSEVINEGVGVSPKINPQDFGGFRKGQRTKIFDNLEKELSRVETIRNNEAFKGLVPKTPEILKDIQKITIVPDALSLNARNYGLKIVEPQI